MRSFVTDTLIKLGRRLLGPRQLNHLVRFAPVLELVRKSGSPDGSSLLDVGSGSEGISTLLGPGWTATAVDSSFDDYAPDARSRPLEGHQQLGDVRALPFADESFDVAVAVDLMEHVSPADRAQAVREICRVVRRRAVIACPAGDEALQGDRRLAEHFTAAGRPVPGWLAEHLENGFPTAAEIAAVAESFGDVSVLRNESVAAHERLILAEHRILPALALRLACRPLERLMTSRRPRAQRTATAVLATVRGHDAAPAYRAIVVVDRGRLT